MLYTWDQYNIVSQLHFNKFFLNINKFWDVIYSMMTIINHTILYVCLKVAKRVDLKSSHPKGKKL